jgi:hypothetical protein
MDENWVPWAAVVAIAFIGMTSTCVVVSTAIEQCGRPGTANTALVAPFKRPEAPQP